MQYQSKEPAGSLSSGWNQMVNSLVLFWPGLFGCNQVTVKNVVTRKEFEDLSTVLQKLGAVKIGEANDSSGKCHHYFRVEKRPIALLLEEQKSVKMIAPRALIEYAQNELKIVLS